MRLRRHISALLLAVLLSGCSGLLFFPERDLRITPDRVGLAYRDVEFSAADGVELHGWFLPAENPPGSGRACTIVFLHGNAQNISTHFAAVWWLPAAGYNVFIFDYRGYGHSSGEPSLAGLHLDVEAALDTAAAFDKVDPDRIIVFGQSLGASVAITALAQSKHLGRVRALAVEGAFSSYREITREKLAELWLTWPLQVPLSWGMENGYKPLEAIGRISPTPVLIIHGQADEIIPPHHADLLYAAAKHPKEKWLLPDVAHIQSTLFPEIRERILRYFGEHCGAGSADPE